MDHPMRYPMGVVGECDCVAVDRKGGDGLGAYGSWGGGASGQSGAARCEEVGGVWREERGVKLKR